jgi:uncharacterized protein
MAINQFWQNLAVNNIATSAKFYRALGFLENTQYPQSSHSASFIMGSSKVVLMLFTLEVFKNFGNIQYANPTMGTSALMNIDAESKEEIDALALTILSNGGEIHTPASWSQGWMYVMGFQDPDGHHWNILYMDSSKLSTQK